MSRIETEEFKIKYIVHVPHPEFPDCFLEKGACFNCAVKAVINDNRKVETDVTYKEYATCDICEDYI